MPLHFKLFNSVNVFIVELILLYQTLFDKVNVMRLIYIITYSNECNTITLYYEYVDPVEKLKVSWQ